MDLTFFVCLHFLIVLVFIFCSPAMLLSIFSIPRFIIFLFIVILVPRCLPLLLLFLLLVAAVGLIDDHFDIIEGLKAEI